MSFMDFVALAGYALRLLGLLVFGVAIAWFTLTAYRQAGERWQMQIAIYLGLLFFAALLARLASAAGLGGFALGAGAGLLYWGLRKEEVSDEDD